MFKGNFDFKKSSKILISKGFVKQKSMPAAIANFLVSRSAYPVFAMHNAFGIYPDSILCFKAFTVSKPFITGILRSRKITLNPVQKHDLHGFYFLSSHFFSASDPFNAFSVLIENFERISYNEMILNISSSTIRTLVQHFELILY